MDLGPGKMPELLCVGRLSPEILAGRESLGAAKALSNLLKTTHVIPKGPGPHFEMINKEPAFPSVSIITYSAGY